MAKDTWKPVNHVDPVTKKDDDKLGSVRDISAKIARASKDDGRAGGKSGKC